MRAAAHGSPRSTGRSSAGSNAGDRIAASVSDIGVLNLFRISCFGFRISGPSYFVACLPPCRPEARRASVQPRRPVTSAVRFAPGHLRCGGPSDILWRSESNVGTSKENDRETIGATHRIGAAGGRRGVSCPSRIGPADLELRRPGQPHDRPGAAGRAAGAGRDLRSSGRATTAPASTTRRPASTSTGTPTATAAASSARRATGW